MKDNRAYEYCLWATQPDNRKAPHYVKLQARSWLDIADGKNPEAYFDEKAYKKISKILKLMIHPDLKCPMYHGLEDYAFFFIIAVFCTKLKDTRSRYYITALLKIAKKNFKTFNAAVIFIIGLLTEPSFSRLFSVAPDLRLSSEVQVAIKKIIKVSPLLNTTEVFKLLRKEIRCELTDNNYTPLAYSEDKLEASLANIFLADEAGLLDSYPIEIMRSSQITLSSKLGIILSTEYPNDNNVMIDETDISKKVLDGLLDDIGEEDVKRRFSLLYEPDDDLLKDDQWQTNDLVIYQSNPVAVVHEHIFKAVKTMRTMAVLYENKRENYLCKHNNIKYKGLGIEGYVSIDKVRECKIVENLEFWKGKDVYLGLDLSQTEDNTAIGMVCEANGKIYAKVWGFIPKDNKELKSKKEGVDYQRLTNSGTCFECGDEVIDYLFIEQFIIGDEKTGKPSLEKRYGVNIVQIGYDRYNALSTVQKLEAAEYECVEIKQHSSVLHAPTKLLKEQILSKLFQYEENQMLEINFQNARCTEDTNLNKYVNKKKSAGKVDMVVAIINATYLLQQEMLFGNDDFIAQT